MSKNTFLQGNDLMLFDEEGKSLAFATSHSLTLSADPQEVTTKDNGNFSGYVVTKTTWEIQSENLFTLSDFDKLFTKMMAKEPIMVYFGLKNEDDPTKTVANGDYDSWTGKNASCYGGMAYIASLTANASAGDKATYSVTLKGSGSITKETTVPKAN